MELDEKDCWYGRKKGLCLEEPLRRQQVDQLFALVSWCVPSRDADLPFCSPRSQTVIVLDKCVR